MGHAADANNEANFSVTSMNIEMVFASRSNSTSAPAPPCPGSFSTRRAARQDRFLHRPRIPDNNIFARRSSQHHPRDFKGKQSKDGLEQRGSCHPDGLADGVTWIFAPGRARPNR